MIAQLTHEQSGMKCMNSLKIFAMKLALLQLHVFEIEITVCLCAFLSVNTEDWKCYPPDGQSPCAQNVIESHRRAVDLCMLFPEEIVLLRSLSAITMRNKSD